MKGNKVKISFVFDTATKAVSDMEVLDLNTEVDLTDELVTFKITTLKLSDNILNALQLKVGGKIGLVLNQDGSMYLVNPKFHTSTVVYNITGKKTVSVRTVLSKSYLTNDTEYKCVLVEPGKIQLNLVSNNNV